jgi:hypothetical protein
MKLSDTQLVVLNIACQRVDRRLLPLPEKLKGGAAEKVIASLIAKGLVEEAQAELKAPVWRTAEDDQRLTLLLTDQAFETLGIEPEQRTAAARARRGVLQSRATPGPTEPRSPPAPALCPQKPKREPAPSRRA